MEATKIPTGPVPNRSDHSSRCGNVVCSPSTAPSFVQRHVPIGTESAPVHHRPDGKDGHTSAGGHAARETGSHSPLFDDIPNDLEAEAGASNPASLADRTKERPGCNPGGRHPGVNSNFHPIRDR